MFRKFELRPLMIWILLTAGVICGCVASDSIFYGKITVTPFNFFMVNVYNNLGKLNISFDVNYNVLVYTMGMRYNNMKTRNVLFSVM